MEFIIVFRFDGIALLVLGTISVILGVIGKGGLFWWGATGANPRNKTSASLVNILFGMISFLVGLSLLVKH